jgi:hypothetical protein
VRSVRVVGGQGLGHEDRAAVAAPGASWQRTIGTRRCDVVEAGQMKDGSLWIHGLSRV